MHYNFDGKTALITGATSGLGERMAFILAECGARVLLAGRREALLQSIHGKIPESFLYVMDVADYKSVCTAFQKIEEDGHHIDICINSAGIGKLTPYLMPQALTILPILCKRM